MDLDGKHFLEIASMLTTQRDEENLLTGILEELRSVCSCERGVLFLWQNNRLISRATLGKNNLPLRHQPWLDEWSVCAAKAQCLQALGDEAKIRADIAIQNEDMENGDRTESLLAVPMLSPSGELFGVIRLTNPRDNQGQVIPFSKDMQEMIWAIANLSAVSLENQQYIEEIRALLASFVRVISAAIDERTPFNANHTRSMAKYGWKLISFLNEQHEAGKCNIYFSPNRRQQFMMSIWLHDMGKMVIPNHIMNKDSRLGHRLNGVLTRLERIDLLTEIQYLSNQISKEEFLKCQRELNQASALIMRLNHATVLTPEDKRAMEKISGRTYREKDGRICPWLKPEEIQCLQIKKGTLTDEERQIMEGHVAFTEKLLGEIVFSKEYSQVPVWAAAHHEYLDGSGYPKGLKGDEIPTEVRLLTILDIFDALTASDRPYKKPIPIPEALETLQNMGEEGKLDKELITLFAYSHCWENGFLPLL